MVAYHAGYLMVLTSSPNQMQKARLPITFSFQFPSAQNKNNLLQNTLGYWIQDTYMLNVYIVDTRKVLNV